MKLATLCYIKKVGKTLMIHRIKREKDFLYEKWNGLGGKFNPGESPEECVIREVREESGLSIKNPLLKGIISFPNNLSSGEDWYVFVFIAKNPTGKLKENEEGHLDWIDDKKLLDLNLQPADKIFLPLLNQPKIFSAKFVLKDFQLVDYKIELY